MSLNDLKSGESALIEHIEGDMRLVKRLMALGYISGTKVTVKGSAPLGDPIIIKVRGSEFALRRKDAKNIYVMEA
ncbi:MAG: FeoA family protein [Clostridiales bacterium]|nr:FeoA family protein [Clostridiales bacterium]HBM79493.1 ferrous iron transport protein A [Clostridiaceae bacterium]